MLHILPKNNDKVSINIIIFTSLAEAVGEDILKIDFDQTIPYVKVFEVIHKVCTLYGEKIEAFLQYDLNEFLQNLIIIVNGKIVGRDKDIYQTDDIILFFPAEGGS